MKKLTVFLMLLMCVSFAEMSAQTVRWEVSGSTWLQISVNGNLIVNSRSSSGSGAPAPYGPQYGSLSANSGDLIEVRAGDSTGNTSAVLSPIISEDSPEMIGYAAFIDYNFINEEHTQIYESFIMPDNVPMYIGMNM